jgi:hypothetical protein
MRASTRERCRPFYRPYRWAAAGFELGLRPFGWERWITMEADYASNMREKRKRVAEHPDRYYRTLPSSRPAQQELRVRVAAHLLRDHPQHFVRTDTGLRALATGAECSPADDAPEPLLQLSQVIEEDFMLLEAVDGAMCITAASNAYSSSGRLVASVGGGMESAHATVPALTSTLGRRIDRILASVHPELPAERFNWQLTPLRSIFFPHDNPHAANAAATHEILATLRSNPERAGELLWIRVERQTLSRLPGSGAVAFSLKTYSDPLASIESDGESVRALLALLRGYSAERLRYSEMDIAYEPIIEWLEAAARAS